MKRLIVIIKGLAQKLLNRVGYKLERLSVPSQPIDVFALAVRKTMLERGDAFFFVQIGANDGVTGDSIRPFVEKFHCAGLLVEPQPAVFEKLRQNYSTEQQLRFENSAIAHENGTARLYINASGQNAHGLASFQEDLFAKHFPTGTKVGTLDVPALTFETLLHSHAVQSFDLLQIDVEGFDYEVIKMVDFKKFRPAVIHYEHWHLSDDDRAACEALLGSNGYRLHSSGVDTTAIIQN